MHQSDANMNHRDARTASESELLPSGRGLTTWPSRAHHESFMEISLLLPNWQMMELEEAASHLGLTTGQLLRRLISNCLAGRDNSPTREDG